MFVERLLPIAATRLVTIAGETPVIEAAHLLLDRRTDLIAVLGVDGVLAGVVTKTDIVRQMSQCHGAGCCVAVSTVMTPSVVFCQPTDPLSAVWSTMKDRGLKNIPIVDQDKHVIGVVNARDALEVLRRDVEDEEVLLRDYVMCVGYH